jgi:hypothetical protein
MAAIFKTGRIEEAFRDPIQQLNGLRRAGFEERGTDWSDEVGCPQLSCGFFLLYALDLAHL